MVQSSAKLHSHQRAPCKAANSVNVGDLCLSFARRHVFLLSSCTFQLVCPCLSAAGAPCVRMVQFPSRPHRVTASHLAAIVLRACRRNPPILSFPWRGCRERERKRMCFVREFPWLLAWEGDVIDAHSSPLLQCFHKLEEPMCSHMTRRKPQAYQCHSRIHPHPNRYSSLVFRCHSIIHNFSTFKQYVIAY